MVIPHVGAAFDRAKLCGGTALSRFYLQHRLSYDLDFFLPTGFNAQALLDQLVPNVVINNLEITHDQTRADQLHFTVDVGDVPIKMSFVEDMYADVFPPIATKLVIQNRTIQTEGLDGLYHRKLRTVVGWADAQVPQPVGGRQTARDMFDLFVLSQARMPLRAFIERLPYAFATTAFEDGLANMPWFDLILELKETIAAPKWQAGLDVELLRDHLYAEMGMCELPDPKIDEKEEVDGAAEDQVAGRKARRLPVTGFRRNK